MCTSLRPYRVIVRLELECEGVIAFYLAYSINTLLEVF